MVDSRQMEKMIIEIRAGTITVDGESKERAEMRKLLKQDIDDIVSGGGIIDIPGEITDISDNDPLAR